MNSVSEKVDERILRLLRLEFVFDLDYDTYFTLLGEAIVSGKNRLPPEELALLSNERKRIRGKKGRFKPQKQKITADKISTTKFLKPTIQPISSPFLPVATPPPQIQSVNLTSLQEPLESIKGTLASFLSFRKNANEQERKNYENKKRQKREEGLENIQKGMRDVSNSVKKFISPFESIIDRIWRFLLFTLLGNAFTQLINWFSDQKNTKKVEVLQRFLKDWWPTLLGAAVLFLTPFGRFVRGVLRIVGGLTGRLIAQIPKIAGAVKVLKLVALRHPLLSGLAIGAAAVGGVAATVNYFNKQKEGEGEVEGGQEIQQFSSGGSVLRPLFTYNAGNPYAQLFGYGGITENTGQRISGFGPDTQLIAAQPGEIVINKKTVESIGADTFLTLNRYYGGPNANQPKIGRLFNTGGMVGGNQSPLINSRALQIFNRLRTRGLSPTAAMGIVANIGVETGYTYSPSTSQRGGGPGRGLVQWESGGRFDTDNINLQSFAKSKNKPWNDLHTQVDFIIHELNNHPEFIPLRTALNGAKSVQEATQLFLTRYEKAGVSHLDRRFEVGKQLQQSLSKSAAKPAKKEEKKEKEDQFSWLNPFKLFNFQKKRGGGSIGIKENTGLDIPADAFSGAGTDKQLIAAQPGEHLFMLTKKAVENGAVPALDQLLALFDTDSNPAKELNYKSNFKKIPEITPLLDKNNQITYLPDINSSSGSSIPSVNNTGGPQVPPFLARSPKSAVSTNKVLYGIDGVG